MVTRWFSLPRRTRAHEITGYRSSATMAANIFFRQLRNFIFDTTLVPPSVNVTGINWPSAQATSLHNVVVNMSTDEGVQHIGLMGGGELHFVLAQSRAMWYLC